jgi:DNA (cytosine-5)-methyltransferase 1
VRSGRPRLLDLFCGAGGATRGYQRAGFYVVGVDHKLQPRYAGDEFVQADALEVLSEGFWSWDGADVWDISQFAAIHAPPPCQAYSDITGVSGDRATHPDLIAVTRDLLEQTRLPYVIENVAGAPLRATGMLCGTSFPALRVIRHRYFETNWPLLCPPCGRHPLLYVPDKRRPHQGTLDETTAFVSVTGGGNCSVAAARDAMGIDWMTKDELNDAIPPAFTEFIGTQLMAHVRAGVAA